ncbi:MAG: SOS response-associated peptidase family protein, partial [Alphaproteobacteria bacterium]
MCGRFTQKYTWREVRDFLDLFGPAQNLQPRYNLAPTQDAFVVRADEKGKRFG